MNFPASHGRGLQLAAMARILVPVVLILLTISTPAPAQSPNGMVGNGLISADSNSLSFTSATVVTTGSVSLTGSSTATLNGTVNPYGLPTTWYFQYWNPAESGTNTTPKLSLLSLSGSNVAVDVRALVTGLKSDTDYSYQLVAVNASGTTTGSLQTLTTAGAAPAVSTGTATVLSYQSAMLTGTAIPYGEWTSVYFQVGTTTAYGRNTSSTLVQVSGTNTAPFSSGTITGLKGATPYHYRAVATNSLGTAYGLDNTFSTPSPPPVVTTGGVATGTNGLTWSGTFSGTVNPSGLPTKVWFEYGGNTRYGLTTGTQNLSAIGGATTQAASVASLVSGTTYHYRIVAANLSGTSYGSDATFATPGKPIVTTGGASSMSSTGATLNGTVNACWWSAKYYFEYWRPSVSGTNRTSALSLSGTNITVGVSTPITGLNPATSYSFRLVASNTDGLVSGLTGTFTTSSALPSVTTASAFALSYQVGTLNGIVVPNGLPTTAWFQYGTTIAYGLTTAPVLVSGSGTNAIPVSSGSIAGLTGGTIYHYRAVARNSLGTVYAQEDKTFTTKNPPPVVATGGVSKTGTSGFSLNASVNPSGLPTATWFEYGPDTRYGITTGTVNLIPLTSATNRIALIASTGLVPGTTYHYRITATNSSGISLGNDATFAPTGTPIVTTGSVSLTGSTSTTLSGTLNPCWSPTAWHFEYWSPSGSGTTTTTNLSLSSTTGIAVAVSASIARLNPSTSYFYRLIASNTNGLVSGSTQTFTTSKAAPVVTTGKAINIVATGVVLSGTINPYGSPATYYFQYWNQSASAPLTTARLPLSGTTGAVGLSGTVTGLTSNTPYSYRLVAVNASDPNTSGTGSTLTFTTVKAPPVVATGGASNITAIGVTLSGTINPSGSPAKYYFVVSSTSSTTTATFSLPSSAIASPVSIPVTGLSPNTPYSYRLVAVNASDPNTSGTGSTLAFSTAKAPPAVTTNGASHIVPTGATLSGTINPCWSPTKYYFVVSSSSTSVTTGTFGPLVGGIGISVSGTIAGLSPNAIYSCYLVAFNTSGTTCGLTKGFTTANPAVITGTATGLSYRAVTLTGTVTPFGVPTNVYFQIGTTTAYGLTTTGTQVIASGTNAVSFSSGAIVALTPATTYHYRAAATNSFGTPIPPGQDNTFTTPNPPPVVATGVVSKTGASGYTLNGVVNPSGLSTAAWFEYGLDTHYGFTTGTQSLSAGKSGINLNALLPGLLSGTTYHYRLVATNTSGTSGDSPDNDATFATAGAPIVTTGVFSNISATGTVLSGTINPCWSVTKYYFLVSSPSTSATTSILSLAGGGVAIGVSAPVTGLSPNTSYSYRLIASNINPAVSGSLQSFMTASAPPAVMTGTAAVLDYQSVTLSGTATPYGLPTKAWFQYGTTTTYGITTTGTQVLASGTNRVPFAPTTIIAGLKGSTVYHYRAAASNSLGTVFGPDRTFTTPNPPPVVTTNPATQIIGTGAVLSGTVNPSGLPILATYFEYGLTPSFELGFLAPDVPIPYNSTAVTAVTVHMDSLLTGTTYYFRLVSMNASGSANGSTRTLLSSLGRPLVSTGLATQVTGTSVVLSGTVNPSGLSTTAWFEYRLDSTYQWGKSDVTIPVSPTQGTAVTARLAGLLSGTTYHYRIAALNTSGTSTGSDATFATAGKPVATTGGVSKVTVNGATLGGTVNPCGLTGSYWFSYWSPSTSGTTVTKPSVTGSGLAGITVGTAITGLTQDTVYSYCLMAANLSGTVSGLTQTFTTPGPPKVASGRPALSSNVQGVLVSGSANPDGLSTTVYFQYGLTTSYGANTAVQNAGASMIWAPFSATIAGLQSNTLYHYRIVATNSASTSVFGTDQTFSTPVSAPVISTVAVTGTGEYAALIKASINPQGGSTNVWFEYGATGTYGKTTGTTTLLASGSESICSGTLFALSPHTNFHARCVAQNAQGISRSQDTTFKTLPRFDANGDGYSELLLSNTDTGETLLFTIGSPTGTIGTLAVESSTYGPYLPSSPNMAFCGEGEFDRGGTIGWVFSDGQTIQKWDLDSMLAGSGTGVQLVTGTFVMPAGSKVAGVADMNADGYPDLVLIGPNQQVTFWMLNGFKVVAQAVGPVLPAGFVIVGLDDLNGDGKPDLLIWNPGNGKTEILTMNGVTSLLTTVGPTIPPGWQLVGVNVYTGTGAPNWLLFDLTTRDTEIWEMQGSTKLSTLSGPNISYTFSAGFSLMGTK